MYQHEVVAALEGVVGMQLVTIEDSERQAEIDNALEVIEGWDLVRITRDPLYRPSHPGGYVNVHLHFSEPGDDFEYVVSLRAADVHTVTVTPHANGNGTLHTRCEVLFKRGHVVALELV